MGFSRNIVVLAIALLGCVSMYAQADRNDVRAGNRQFRKGDWTQADLSYRKALAKDSTSFVAAYDLANNLYRQQNHEEAAKMYSKVEGVSIVAGHGFDLYFNKGDNAVAMEDWQTAVSAFRQAMILNPESIEAKENYLYAKSKLQNQMSNDQMSNKEMDDKQREKSENNDQGGDQVDDDKYIDDKNADKAQNDPDSKEKNQDDKSEKKNQQPKPQQGSGGISGQQAQQILQAMQAKEDQTQDKVKSKKALNQKSRQKEKNW